MHTEFTETWIIPVVVSLFAVLRLFYTAMLAAFMLF